jgi:hypothetical protein
MQSKTLPTVRPDTLPVSRDLTPSEIESLQQDSVDAQARYDYLKAAQNAPASAAASVKPRLFD